MDEYLDGKQTYRQLADRYGCSARTIQRCVDKAKAERNVLACGGCGDGHHICSKANHVEIQRLVVGMKDELEKIKEQLGNIL